MTLRQWIADNGLTQASAAEMFEVHEITLSRWINGHAIPRRAQMARIGVLTKNAVLPNDFFASATSSAA
jgi:predicted XRE-type DNA-binding protein